MALMLCSVVRLGAVIVTANMNDIASLDKALDGANALFLLFVLGVVIVTANINDIPSLEKALDGANAIFCFSF